MAFEKDESKAEKTREFFKERNKKSQIARNQELHFVPEDTQVYEDHRKAEKQMKLERLCQGRERSVRRVEYSTASGKPHRFFGQSENVQLERSLPKGVIRGCNVCDDCQQITAKWRPEEQPNRDKLTEAPVFRPNEEEFKDPLKYVASICQYAKEHGICRISPPPSWQPPCLIKQISVWESFRFRSKVQRVDVPYFDGFNFKDGRPEFTLCTFNKYSKCFKKQYFSNYENGKLWNPSEDIDDEWYPSKSIEGEYWRIVENPTEEIEVLCGSELDAAVFGSGFPVRSSVAENQYSEYMDAPWNLNNVPQLPGSLLRFETSKASSVLVPHMDIGMCFSSYFWKVEEHHLYSLRYLHAGAPKIMYGIPDGYSAQLDAAFKKKGAQISPWTLVGEGIPVCRTTLYTGQFVLTLPGAVHSGFDRGFNFSETVNFAPLDWLPHGGRAVELYSRLGKKTSLSYDKLLLGAALQSVRALWEEKLCKRKSVDNLPWIRACGKDGLVTEALKLRAEEERKAWMNNVSASSKSSVSQWKIDQDFDAVKRECPTCFSVLFLSAAGCSCSPDKYFWKSKSAPVLPVGDILCVDTMTMS